MPILPATRDDVRHGHGHETLRRVSAADRRARVLFLDLLRRHLAPGAIEFAAEGTTEIVGSVSNGQADVTVAVHHPRLFRRMLAAGNLGLAEAYMDGDFEVVHGTLATFLGLLLASRLDERISLDPAAAARLLTIRWVDRLRGKARRVQAHYDRGDDLFELFLDPSLTYSCGYATSPDDDLERLQQQKLDRICRKLRLEAGQRLLDIGCGYGGLLAYAARVHGVRGTGITNSRAHFERATKVMRDSGLADRVNIVLGDYQEVNGLFDRIVSVGMMEHVPPREYSAYIRTIAGALSRDGLGLVHTIGCNGPNNGHDPFIQRYIFPGSGQPRLSEIAAELERHRLLIVDVENIVRHYGYTVERWLENFRANAHRLDREKYDRRFVRMWEYYLSCGIAAAAWSDSAVYQVLFMKDAGGFMPLQRV